MGTGHPLGIHCPRCGTEVVVRGGSVGGILAEALKLRAELGSVGLTCEACGLDFLYSATGKRAEKSDAPDPATMPDVNSGPQEQQIGNT